ncbi:MarR family winged helix-turn-helix transcriptional regulator [Aestuariivirga sp.]|jgi:DNA-binding MarR family transcriptional regulator|uniref:MarR family winged helix-turn-helix transcriptional regulator n=1 Tax=Aestuariivirga sp. TaxID=2650926 RepID=UPI0037838249
MEKSNLIFRINQLVRAIEQTSGLGDLDISARAILNFIGEADAQSKSLNVSDVVKGPGFGTAPTVYARLAELEQAGWIKSEPDPHDGRAKRLTLTPLAKRTYARMSADARKLLSPKNA